MDGVTVAIAPRYIEGRSRPEDGLHIWAYEVTITLASDFEGEVQLLGRHWEFKPTRRKSQITDGNTVMGERPILSWGRQAVYYYRSVVALPVSSGTMNGYFRARINGSIDSIPVPTTTLNTKKSLFLPDTQELSTVSKSDEHAFMRLLLSYNKRVATEGQAWLSSSYFPNSIRPHFVNWILEHPEYNEEKYNIHNLIHVTEFLKLNIDLPELPTTDIFCIIVDDDLELIFIYNEMDIDSAKKEILSVLRKHGLGSDEDQRLAVDELCARIIPPPPLPDKPPKLYVDRPQGQNIIEFLRDPDGWGPFVKEGVLSRVELRHLDFKAYQALNNWLQGNDLPPDMSIPKKSEVIERVANRFRDVLAADRPARVVWTKSRRRKTLDA